MHVMRVGMFGRTSPTGPPKVCAQLRSVQQKLTTDGFAKKLQRRVQKEGFLSCCSRKVGRFLLPSLEKDGFLAAGVLKQLLRRDLRCSHAIFCQTFRI